MKYKFLRWWLVFCLIVVGSVLAYLTGIVERVNAADFTKISFVIYGLFLYASIRCGAETKRGREYRGGYFLSSLFIKLGLIGTLVGLIYVFTTSLGSIDVAQPQTMRCAISTMMKGMGTALYTTIIGLVCSLVLQLQLYNMGKENENTA